MEELIRIVLKWLKPIALVGLLVAVISAIVSLLLPAYYQSNVTFLTINPHMMDATNLFRQNAGKDPVYLFGGKGDVGRFMTYAESRALEGYIIDKFNLHKHYDVDTNDVEKDYWVTEALRDHFKLIKTPNNILHIEVLDKDPNFAATMANEIAARLDYLNKSILLEKKKGLSTLYDNKAKEKKNIIEVLRDSLNNSIETNPEDTVTANILESMVDDAVYEYLKINSINDKHKAAMEQEYSTLYIIEKAEPAVKRAKPVRSLIVLSSTLIALLAMVLIAIFIEKLKSFELE